MNLYIKIVDGQPFEHPITEENLRQAYPHINLPNLPPDFARFERVQLADADLALDMFETKENTYEWAGDVVKEVWKAVPMDEEHRARTLQDFIRKKEDTISSVISTFEARLSQDLIPEFRQALEEHIALLRGYIVADDPFKSLPKANFHVRFQRNSDGSITLRSNNEEI